MSVNGRGAYYKAKYGGRGKGKGNSTHPHNTLTPAYGEALSSYKKENNDEATVPDHFAHQAESNRQDLQKLSRNLKNIDGMQYGNYKLLSGQRYVQIDKPFPFSLEFVHIQTDAYASPSRISIRILLNDIGFHPDLLSSRVRRVAVSDFLARNFTSIISGSIGIPNAAPRGWAGLKGGCINMSRPSQHILQRTSVSISETPLGTCIMEARITVSLPARGRTIEGGLADTILVKELPLLLESAFSYHKLDGEALRDHVYLVEDQQFLRAALDDAGLVAFVSEASLLARKSGASDLPLDTESAVRFQPPARLLREIVLPNRGAIRGMGIPKGITLVRLSRFYAPLVL
jgi:predicted ABC-class ATPase